MMNVRREEASEPAADQAESSLGEEVRVSLDFVTLGILIIDEIAFLPPTPSVHDVIGGAGTYSALGARICSAGPRAASVGWIVDMGSDFPAPARAMIESWGTSAILRSTPERQTTRGFNGYDAVGKRAFRYLSPKIRLTGGDLDDTMLWSKSFHLICSPVRCQELVGDILARRKASSSLQRPFSRPLFIWEPVPDLCTPDELLRCTNTLPLVDICSPNHMELGGFLGDDRLDPNADEISRDTIERWCKQLLACVPLQSYAIVVRAGDKGCYLAKNGVCVRRSIQSQNGAGNSRKKLHYHSRLRHDTDIEANFVDIVRVDDETAAFQEAGVDVGVEKWLPPFHREKVKVVDPTGAGNAFLGGLAVALARGKNIEEAAVWANVSASFAIEQISVPLLIKEDGGRETWNGVSFEDRLSEYQSLLKE